MITIPLYTLLFFYLAFLIFFAVLSVVNLSHLSHTGALTFTSFIVTIIIGILVALIFLGTWYLLKDIDWLAPITIWNNASLGISNNAF